MFMVGIYPEGYTNHIFQPYPIENRAICLQRFHGGKKLQVQSSLSCWIALERGDCAPGSPGRLKLITRPGQRANITMENHHC